MGIVLSFRRRSVVAPERPLNASPAAIRSIVAKEIERLIGILDAIDGDPDLEPGGDDEPSLGWLSNGGHSWRDGNVDLEVDRSPVERA